MFGIEEISENIGIIEPLDSHGEVEVEEQDSVGKVEALDSHGEAEQD
jgi:hypothetical protein